METGIYCAYNLSRKILLSEHVREAGEDLEPLQFVALLVNGPGLNRHAAVWLRRCSGSMNWLPRLFAFDLAFLGQDQTIIECASIGPGTEFPPTPAGATSLLFLPDHRLAETGSTRGNVIEIWTKAELAAQLERASHNHSGAPGVDVKDQTLQNQPEASPSWRVTRLSESASEPFAGSLVYLPGPVAPVPQSSEFFLTREEPQPPVPEQIDEVLQEQDAEIAQAIEAQSDAIQQTTGEFPLPEIAELEQFQPNEMIAEPVEQDIEPPPLLPPQESGTQETWPEPASLDELPSDIAAEQSKPRRDAEKERLSSRIRFQRWLSGQQSSRKRRADRMSLPGLVAFYWSGGAPKPHEILNISKSGFYLRTKDLWLPDTLVRMTLEKPPNAYRGEKKQSIGVLARVVRIDEGGVGHEFVTTEDLLRIRTRHILPDQGTSQKDLDEFLGVR